MAKKAYKKRTMKRPETDDHMPVEPDLAYWLEHVVHWYALLGAVVAALAVGYAFFSGHAVFAGS